MTTPTKPKPKFDPTTMPAYKNPARMATSAHGLRHTDRQVATAILVGFAALLLLGLLSALAGYLSA